MELILGDCLEELKKLPENSIDAIVTDPPAGISFMSADWDHNKGGRDQWVKWLREVMGEARRTLKPGGHALVWALPRTSHWTALALEDAGFEIRDCIYHIFGSGFPKNLDLGKAVDKLQGNKREVVGRNPNSRENCDKTNTIYESGTVGKTDFITKGSSEWEGWGTALKPAVECWWLVRNPISEKTIVENVLKWGVGGLAIDNCRVGLEGEKQPKGSAKRVYESNQWAKEKKYGDNTTTPEAGRFPANLVLECICNEVITEPTEIKEPEEVSGGIFSPSTGKPAGRTYKGGRQIHTNPECPCYMLDRQSGLLKSGIMKAGQKRKKSLGLGGYHDHMPDEASAEGTYGDSGGASRFFYQAKASRSEKNEGCGENKHPSVKSVSLMEFLVKLITREGQVVLDPFAGTFTTGVACVNLWRDFVGIEKEVEYFKIGEARMVNAINKKDL